MPAEIKLELIGKMELNERLALRCTANAEKSLVDSQKMNFFKGKFFWNFFCVLKISLKSENGILYGKKFYDETKACNFMKYIWKIGNFENLKFDSLCFLARQCATSDVKISVKNIDFYRTRFQDMFFILENTDSGVESINIETFVEDVDFPMEKVLESPNIQNARFWQIKQIREPWLFTELAKIWIDKNSKIGTTFQTSFTLDRTADGAINHFLNFFKNRTLSVSDKRVRIQTNNPATHILLEFSCLVFRLSVISAGMKESDYEENHEEWI
ncbi:unnamed protein product [Caenorhabditis nigoni]